MERKIVIIFEIIFVIAAMSFYTIRDLIPEYRQKIGSSDRLVNSKKCVNIIELKIDDTDFMVMLDDNKKIYHMIFLEKKSLILYNNGIEDKDLGQGLDLIIKKLIEYNYLKNTSHIDITKYDDMYYDEFIFELRNIMSKYDLGININENSGLLEEVASQYNISGDSRENIILELDYYSKELYNSYKNEINKKGELLNSRNSKTFANNVYRKIEKYCDKNNIENLKRNESDFIINMVPADTDLKYYPSKNSWYYVDNKKIYAYIEFIDKNYKYGYCYKGSIDLLYEGECDN